MSAWCALCEGGPAGSDPFYCANCRAEHADDDGWDAEWDDDGWGDEEDDDAGEA